MNNLVFEPHNLHGETIDGEAMPFGYVTQIQESGHRLPVFELNTVFGDLPGIDLAGLARIMVEAPAMAALLRGIDRDEDGDAMLDASGMDEIAAILSRIDGATPTDEREPAQNGPDGHCLHCGRDNRGHEGEPCVDECPQYWEAKGKAHPAYPTADAPVPAPTGEAKPAWFLNSYTCERCGYDWRDEWDCAVDDDCPACGARHISPTESEEIHG